MSTEETTRTHDEEEEQVHDDQEHDDQEATTTTTEGEVGGEEPVQKTPLQSEWTLWFHNPEHKVSHNYFNFLQKVYNFSFVEDFWALFNHIRPPSKIPVQTTYYLFRDGIKPEWEDPTCRSGGEWIFSFGKKIDLYDDWWLNLLLACIGENFEDGEHLCGCACAVRKSQVRLSVWVNTLDKDVVLRLGQRFKDSLGLPDRMKAPQFDFKSFNDQLKGLKNVMFHL